MNFNDKVGVEVVQDQDQENSSKYSDSKLDNEMPSGTAGKDHRQGVKYLFNKKLDHRRKRDEFLAIQRERRDDILDKIRQLEDHSDSDTEDGFDFVTNVGSTKIKAKAIHHSTIGCEIELGEPLEDGHNDMELEKSKKKKNTYRFRKRKAPSKLMHSDWMNEKPDDFDENWIGVLVPVGKRVIIVAYRGKTRVYTRRDQFMGIYKSLLPGGHILKNNDSRHFRGVTILDCIWSDVSKTFYVLDIISWNSYSCNNCDSEYRQFFLSSKFSENPSLLERSNENPFPFIPLQFFTADTFSTIMMSTSPPFPEEVDGILFFHKEAYYITEINPLCLWIQLSDVEKILSISPSPELLVKEFQNPKKKPELESNVEVDSVEA